MVSGRFCFELANELFDSALKVSERKLDPELYLGGRAPVVLDS